MKARKCNGNDLLDKEQTKKPAQNLVINITYHPAFSKLRDLLSKIHILLTPNEEHRRILYGTPVVGFKRGKSLQDILRAKVPEVKPITEESVGCGSKRCKVCEVRNPTKTFSNKEDDRSFHIKGGKLNCNSQNIVYLVQRKTCSMQYVASTSTKFRLRFNNYQNFYRNYN